MIYYERIRENGRKIYNLETCARKIKYPEHRKPCNKSYNQSATTTTSAKIMRGISFWYELYAYMLRVLRWREFAIFYFFNAEIYTTFWKQIRNIESTKCLRFNVFFHIEFFLFCTVLLVALWQWIDGKVKKNRCCINEVYSRFIYYILYKRIVFYIELCIRMSVFYVCVYIIHKTPPLYRLKCVFFFQLSVGIIF